MPKTKSIIPITATTYIDLPQDLCPLATNEGEMSHKYQVLLVFDYNQSQDNDNNEHHPSDQKLFLTHAFYHLIELSDFIKA